MDPTSSKPTPGAISRIYSGAKPSPDFSPLVEVCALRALNGARHAVTISDGGFHVKAVCASSPNGTSPLFDMLIAGRVPQHSMLRLMQWQLMEGGKAPVLLLMTAEVLGVVPEIERADMRLLRPWGAKAAELAMSQDSAPSFRMVESSYTTPEKRAGGSSASAFLSPPPIANPFPKQIDSVGTRGFQAEGAKVPERNGAASLQPFHGDSLQTDNDADADAPTQPSAFPPAAANAHAWPVAAAPNPYGSAGGPSAAASATSGCGATGVIQMSPLTQHPTTSLGLGGFTGGFGGASSAPPSLAPAGPGPAASSVSQLAPVPQENPYRATSTGSRENPYSQAPAGPPAAPAARGSSITSYFQSRPPPAEPAAQRPPGFDSLSSPAQRPAGFGSLSAFAGASVPVTPISELTPYGGSRWQIKARVTSKRDVRKFTNSRGEGQLFSVELVDKSGGECTATFFGKAVDLFVGVLVQGQVYYFAKGKIKPANQRFDKGSYALTFDEHSVIEAAERDDGDIPGVQYSFRSFAEVAGPGIAVGTSVDIMGVICDVREVSTITVRSSGSERSKREIVLWDGSGPDSNQTLDMTIWGDRSADDYELGAVVFVKTARVNEWNSMKSVNFSGLVERNPDDRRAFELLARYKASGNPQAPPRASRGAIGAKKTLEDIQEEDLHLGPPIAPGQNLDPNGPRSVHRHSANATVISQIHASDRPPFYFSCPEEVSRGANNRLDQCRKKVSPLGDATPERGQRWRCEAGHECQQPKARFLYRAQVSDHTGSMEINVFDEVGQRLFGCDADTLACAWEDPLREDEVHRMTKAATWRRVSLGMRSQKEVWQNEDRTKVTADSASSIALVKDAKSMLADIHGALGV